ncbi:MAG: glycosyltransferase family 39 protein [Candidatus Shapirobacteria bacterium]|nr:glycosyltransferase family 39 protein [Candidatus Shapirobacteria bacterium]
MIKKNNWGIKIFLSFILVGLYFFTRLQNLTAIPVFGDEAIYIRWSQIIKNEETLRFIPQTDGKQPLFMWITAILLRFHYDPLVTGRFVSVSAGFLLLLGIFFTTCIIIDFFNPSRDPIKFIRESIRDNFYYGFLSSLIYLFIPFTFFFDRLAVPDNLLSAFGIWSLFLSLLLAKFRRLDLSMLLGITLGLAWLTKSPAIYFVALSIFTFFIFNFKRINSYYLPIISSIIAFFIYNILRLGPQFNMIALRNKDYVWGLSEIIKHPLDPLTPHLHDTLAIFSQYISWPVLIFALIGLFLFFFYQKNTHLFVLLAWGLLPLLANSAIAKVFTARYILFIIPSFLVLISIGLSVFFKNNLSRIIFTLILLIPNLFWLQKISLDPFNVQLLSTESGYISGWTSGWGIKNSADFLKERSKSVNVIVGTEGSFGTLPDGLQIYTDGTKQLTIIGLGLGFTSIPNNLVNARNFGDEVYLSINKSRLSLSSLEQDKLELVSSFQKPNNDAYLLYKLK